MLEQGQFTDPGSKAALVLMDVDEDYGSKEKNVTDSELPRHQQLYFSIPLKILKKLSNPESNPYKKVTNDLELHLTQLEEFKD